MISSEINAILQQSTRAFESYRNVSGKKKAIFLRTIADEIERCNADLSIIAQAESFLPEARINGEIGRTVNQLRAFAALLDAGDWVRPVIDTADASRKPLPKPDIRKMFFPVGPIVVFGASNFPLAFSTAGGDTASALASGCSVIVKSHPAHPNTSKLVASAIQQSIKICNMPEFVFQHVEDSSIEVGQLLVNHPQTKGVAFTGSFKGGMALFELASKRKEPIPVFAEMGSINPVLVLPEQIRNNVSLAETLAGSVTQGVGQFCTNPGLIITIESEETKSFLNKFAEHIGRTSAGKMLHDGIAHQYRKGKSSQLSQAGVSVLAEVAEVDDVRSGSPTLAHVSADAFMKNPALHEEVFGPFSLVVSCKNIEETEQVVSCLQGQLTASVFGTDNDVNQYFNTIRILQQKSGRLIFNGVPTGVEVCRAMHHGGPFPATTDSRFTSVGTDAIYRFVRPVSFQNSPASFLPEELRNENPLGILRCVNNEWTSAAIK